jgi:hypothetical protein
MHTSSKRWQRPLMEFTAASQCQRDGKVEEGRIQNRLAIVLDLINLIILWGR